MFAIAKDRQRTADQKDLDIQEYLDIDNLIDYMIMIHYTGNVDAPVLIGSTTAPRNFYAIRPRTEGGQYKFFLWDSEHSLSEIRVDRTELGVGNADDTPARLYGELRSSAEFRMRFADRIHQHFFNDGALTVQASVDRYMAIATEIDRAIVGESARWGDVRRSTRPYTRDAEWVRERDRLLRHFFPRRHDIILNQWRADRLYPQVEAPSFSQHGGSFEDRLDVMISAPAGEIYYTVDGSDPRDAATDQPSTTAIRWDGQPVILTDSTQLQARLIDQGEWSALTAASFQAAHRPELRITELMYHPAEPAQGVATDIEFLEVANVGQHSLALGGFRLTGGIQFDFPDATLAPAEHVVIVSDRAEYLAHYGSDARVIGEYTGQLSNGGESIRLATPLGESVVDFLYDDDWYPVTDGDGYSLVIVDPAADPTAWNLKSNWRPSDEPGGSPGLTDRVDATVIDQLAVDIVNGRAKADLNGDGQADDDDLRYMIKDQLNTYFGDANLDRRFDSSDLVTIFKAGKYENGIAGSAGWAEGDWNGDGLFNSTDVVLAFQDGGYVAPASKKGASLLTRRNEEAGATV